MSSNSQTHDPSHAGHAVSEDGVCNIGFLNSQLNSVFKNRLSNIGTTELSDDVFQAFQDLLPEKLSAEPVKLGKAPKDGIAFEAIAPDTTSNIIPPTAELETVSDVQPAFSQGGFQPIESQPGFNDAGFEPVEPGATFNQGNFHLVGYEVSEKPPLTSTGFQPSDAVSSGFGDLPPQQNWGEADPEDLKLPPQDPDQEQHGFQPPKWAEILLPVTTDLRSNLPQNYVSVPSVLLRSTV